jgi:hypothetical protein
MSSKSRRRITLAAGAAIAGAAIPIATAFTAWADDIEITYDGKVIFDNFDTMHPFGSSDVGTAAESGTNNDWAIVQGPASDGNIVGLANDSAGSDSNDFAFYSGNPPTAFYGTEGALITNATNSNAVVIGGGNAVINAFPPQYGDDPGQVTNSTAYATNGGTALVGNDGNEPGLTTMTGDYASASGTAHDTTTVAEILDSNNSVSMAHDTGFNPITLEGGSAVDLANNSFADAVNPGSTANIEGGVVNGVPLSDDVPITNVTNIEPDGDIFTAITSNTAYFDGVPEATFFADLFGADGAAVASADWTALLDFYGIGI